MSTDAVEGPPDPQVCQRCRRTFPGDVTLARGPLLEWWACASCRTILFGDRVPA